MELDTYDSLYQEVILDHYRRPRNHQLVPSPDLTARGLNPFCGDEVVFTASLDDLEQIREVGLMGQGCAISQASASMMGESLRGRTLGEANNLLTLFKALMQSKEPTIEERETLGVLATIEGVKRYPVRIKCALLAWSTLQDALAQHHRAEEFPKTRNSEA